jgi:hypothetical protein
MILWVVMLFAGGTVRRFGEKIASIFRLEEQISKKGAEAGGS